MISKLNSQITRYGVSESFNSFIDGLRETPGISERKFRLADVNKMAQYLVCRNYGKACLELSYLAWAVVNYQATLSANDSVNSSTQAAFNAPLLEFFWLNENITPSRFRQAFKHSYKKTNSKIFLTDTGLHIVLEQQSFVISPTRVGLLAVLLEIIMTLAPEQLTIIEQALTTSLDNKQASTAIKKLSSELQKQLYKFLAEHLVPAQQQRRFRYITQWLTSENNSQDRPQSTINDFTITDDTVIAFWQSAAVDDSSPGYKLYASAFNDIVETHLALQQAKQAIALDNANTIGLNSEAGEYSPDIIENIVFNESSESQDYTWLCQTPKFLTKSQWHFIEPLMQKQPYVKTLALSFTRLAIFGQWQASLVQAKRKSPQLLREKLAVPPAQTYLHYQQQLSKQNNTLTQVTLAISHVFYCHQDSRYLGCILALLPKTTSQQIKKHLASKIDELSKNKQQLTAEKLNKALFIQSQALLLRTIELNRAVQLAKAAFNNNNKDGFQQLPDLEMLDIYQEGYEALTTCQHTIQDCHKELSKIWLTSTDCQLNYCSDVSIFKDMFDKLYGEVNDQ